MRLAASSFIYLPIIVAFSASNLFAEAADTESQIDEGQKIYTTFCSACHPLDPPPKIAPPMRGIVMHYRSAGVSDSKEFAQAIEAWIKQPSAEHSKLPPGAITKFGMMPPLPIVDTASIEKLARWLWEKY